MASTLEFLIMAKDQASDVFDKVGGSVDKSASKMDKFRAVGGVALAAVGAAAVAFGKQSLDAYTDAAEQQAKLEFAFEKFPGLADTNIDALNELNTALQKKTGIDGDETAAAQASLAAYGLTGTQIAKLTPLMQDYATKTGKDMVTAADDMGKAMLGSGKALKGVGVDFTDAGSVGANFDQVMAGLTSTVGGTAEAMGGTAAGKSKILKEQWGDLQEKVGEKLMPIMTKLTDVGIKVVDWISRNSDELQPYVIALGAAAVAFGVLNVVMAANPISLIIIGIAALAAGLIYAYQHSETFRTIVDAAFKAIGDMATWLWNNALQPLIKMFVEGLSAIIYWLGEMFRSLGNVPGFEWAKEAGDKMNKAAKEVNDFSKSIDKIPPKKSVEITVTANYSQLQATALAAARANIKLAGMPGYASGGRPQVGVPALFGEAGVEMWIPDTAGTVLNASQTAAAMNRGPRALDTGGAGGGNIYVQVSVQGDTDPDGAARRIEGLLVDLQTNRGGTLGFLPRA